MKRARIGGWVAGILVGILVLISLGWGEADGGVVVIKDVPHVAQKPDFCGEACVAMWMNKLGIGVDQDWVFDQSGMDPRLGSGVRTGELRTAMAKIGFEPGDVWFKVDGGDEKQIREQVKGMVVDLRRGVPSIVCMHYNDKPNTTEHFRLVLGYDPGTDELIYHEPAAGEAPKGAYQRMKQDEFVRLWPLKYDAKKWTLVRLKLEAGRGGLKKGEVSKDFTSADYAQAVMEVKKKMPRGFAVAISAPFVVVGDVGEDGVKRWGEGTVKWAVTKLKETYFAKDPEKVIAVWLFKDKVSYEKYTDEVFGDTPTTPYGYYSYAHNALIMNISTGGGTLVHEIVHPFVRANFPGCPAWFNEGLGSLYEQSAERDGKIVGLTNWRLAGLQKAIKDGKVPSFEALTGTKDGEFYNGETRATNYAQARYLCYYLQEKGLLQKFYKDYVAGQKDDPTGYKTLVKTLGVVDMDGFKKKWETYVMGLRFP